MKRFIRVVHGRRRTTGLLKAIAIAMVLVAGLGIVPFIAHVQALPAEQRGPAESFTGTVVPGTVSVVSGATQFNLERPKLVGPGQFDPNQLEQVVCRLDGSALAQAASVQPFAILSITGNYDPQQKVFFVTAFSVIGSAAPPPPAEEPEEEEEDNDNDDQDDNDNEDDDDDDDDDNDNNGDDDDDDNDND